MPELAEVEFFRRQWDAGLDRRIERVSIHASARVFRGTDPAVLATRLRGAQLRRSQAHGKQMLFECSRGGWLGIHLGMTGSMRAEGAQFLPGKHDHLVFHLRARALVFRDPRQFGRIRFHDGTEAPEWWRRLPVSVKSPAFTAVGMEEFLARHRKLPIKAALLLQAGFPGVGNWMADEILWRSGLSPRVRAGSIHGESLAKLWRMVRFVCRAAMRHVSAAYDDPPRGWLYHERWRPGGICPRHQTPLNRGTIGGRTTAWCSKCQPSRADRES